MMKSVTMFTTGSCSFCARAKALLRTYEVVPDEIRIDLSPKQRERMVQLTQARSVPQIFIGDEHIGGYDQLSALHTQNKLREKLGLP